MEKTMSTSVVVVEGNDDQYSIGGAPIKYSKTELVEVGSTNGGSTGVDHHSSKSGSNESEESDSNCKNKIRIQVSKTKKPLFFYINLAKKYIKQCYEVELSALGMAIPTVITISEILQRNGLAVQKNVSISAVAAKEDKKGRMMLKAQIEIVLGVADKLDQNSLVLSSD